MRLFGPVLVTERNGHVEDSQGIIRVRHVIPVVFPVRSAEIPRSKGCYALTADAVQGEILVAYRIGAYRTPKKAKRHNCQRQITDSPVRHLSTSRGPAHV
jgi:hypothetical protein